MEHLRLRVTELKSAKNLTNKDLGDVVGLSADAFRQAANRGTLAYAYLEKIANHYSISLNWLTTGEGDINDRSSDFNELAEHFKTEARAKTYVSSLDIIAEPLVNSYGNKFFKYPDDTVKLEVLKIPFGQYKRYFEIQSDNEQLIKEFYHTIFTVDKIDVGRYLAFVPDDDLMNNGGIFDTPSDAEILGHEIGRNLYDNGFESDYGFILMTKQNIYHKDIKDYDKSNGLLTLGSRNPSEEDFSVSINDVFSIFRVIKRMF